MTLSTTKKVLLISAYSVLVIGFIFFENTNQIKSKDFPNKELLGAAIVAIPKNIALTFDDGPYGTSTEKILDILKKENVRATFFVIGKNVEKFSTTTKRIIAEGHLIGNHSYDHAKNLPEMSTSTFKINTEKAESAIFLQTDLKPKIFRPPYGNITPQMYQKLKEAGYTSVLWNVDAKDWDFEHTSTADIENKIINDTKPNSIILLHDGRDTKINYPRTNLIDALPVIIEQLKKEGYNFVTVDKLENIKPYF